MELNESVQPAPRVPLKVDVEFRQSYARQSEKGILKNISLSGAFLSVANPKLLTNDKLIITFIVSGRKRKITASVVWRNVAGCGIEFQPFNNRDIQIVDDLMYYVDSSRKTRRSVLENIFKHVA